MDENNETARQGRSWTTLNWSEQAIRARFNKNDSEELDMEAWLTCHWADFLEDLDRILYEISSSFQFRVRITCGDRFRMEMDRFISSTSVENFVADVFPTTQGLGVTGRYHAERNALEFCLSHPGISRPEHYYVVAFSDTLPS